MMVEDLRDFTQLHKQLLLKKIITQISCSLPKQVIHLTHLPLDTTISQTIFSAFSLMKSFFFKLSLKFVPKGAIDNNPALV